TQDLTAEDAESAEEPKVAKPTAEGGCATRSLVGDLVIGKTALLRRSHAHGAQDFIHGGDGEVNLVHGVVEVGREADAGLGTVVNQDVTAQQFRADFLGVRHINGHGAAALIGITRSVHAPAALFRQFDQAGGHLAGLGADVLHAGLKDDFESGHGGV